MRVVNRDMRFVHLRFKQFDSFTEASKELGRKNALKMLNKAYIIEQMVEIRKKVHLENGRILL